MGETAQNFQLGEYVEIVYGPYALLYPYRQIAEIKGFHEEWIIVSINYRAHRVLVNEIRKINKS